MCIKIYVWVEATGGSASLWVHAGCSQVFRQSTGVKDAQHFFPKNTKKMSEDLTGMKLLPHKQPLHARRGFVFFRAILNLHNILDLCTGTTFQLKETISLD